MKLIYKIETLNQIVSKILKNDEQARKNDALLYLKILINQGYASILNGNVIIPLTAIDTMTRPESVSRIRRSIQNDLNKFKPDEETQIKREQNFKDSRLIWSGGKLNTF